MAVEAAPSISASAANKPIVFFACNLDIAVLLIENLAILVLVISLRSKL
jgi:hypothetical protein